MTKMRSRGVVPLALGVGAFALAFAQRPGLATSDTKINLHLDAGRFLGDVASMWTATGQLGDVQTGQYAGYLFPMGPFFALGHALGISDWVVQRIWLGMLLWLAAWGVAHLLGVLTGRGRIVGPLLAGAATVLNPFVVTYVNRTTVTLLALAALPWLLVATHHGLRAVSRGRSAWRWPAIFALLVAASGGGINGAVTAWMLLGPVLLLLYELAYGGIRWPQARAFGLRTVALSALLSLWWVIPAYVQSAYGIDFLHFTEQPGTVWGTTSLPESLRLMSFWLSYVGIGFAGRAIPYFDDAPTLLFSAPVVLATLLLPAAALTGFVWTRRLRYGPFFLLLALAGLLVMGAGFPNGTPLRHGLTFTYNHVAAVRFLRASYKAAPLLAVALACLAGSGAQVGWGLVRRRRYPGLWRAAGSAGALTILVLAAWPLVAGRAQDAQVSYRQVPQAWRSAASDLDRQLPQNARAMVLPGDLFSFYRWGGTTDPILPALARRPVAERTEVPYADLRATDLLWTIDGLVHQGRLLPGQLPPLLRLMSVRSVITGTDDDLARSDAPPPADVASELAAQPGFATPARSYGALTPFTPAARPGPSQRLPEVRRYDLPSGRGLVRVEPTASPTVLDGSADGLAELAAFGDLSSRHALFFAGDLSPAQLRRLARAGSDVVISDSNRRRAFVASSLEQNVGPTLTASESVSADGLVLDPFGRGPDAETVATFTGVRSVEAPASPQRVQFPEHAPFAALDGSATTAWVADPTLDPSTRWLQVDFERPTDVPYVDLTPYDDAGGSVREVQIAGRTFAVHPGANRLRLGLREARSLRVTLSRVGPPDAGAPPGAGGIAELRIPGVHATEALRSPIDASRALSGVDLSRSALTYVFQRTTGDNPFARDLGARGFSALDVHDAGDAELSMRRVFTTPARRRYRAAAWVSVAPQAADDALDRLAGYRGPVQAISSSRVDGLPGWRASRALDGDPRTAWIADFRPGQTAWLRWRTADPIRLSRLRLIPAIEPVRRPTRIRIRWTGGASAALAVGPGGAVTLPRAIRSRVFQIDILSTTTPAGASAADRRAVGIAELAGIPALPRITGTPSRITTRCGVAAVRVGAAGVSFRLSVRAAAFERGGPILAEPCRAGLTLPAGRLNLVTQPGPLVIDDLRLASAAPDGRSGNQTGSVGGAVLNSGHAGRGSYDGVRIAAGEPSWLVLGESFNRGWQAFCDGRSLGASTPIDGYANGWLVRPGCRSVHFAFAPNRVAAVGYVVSSITALGCLLLLVLLTGGRRPVAACRPMTRRDAGLAGHEYARRWALRPALGAALAVALAFAFVFGLVMGPVAFGLSAVILLRAVGARPLTLAAGALLGVVIPGLYLAQPVDPHGGNHYSYAMDHLSAHRVGVVAFGLLLGALWRSLPRRRPSAD